MAFHEGRSLPGPVSMKTPPWLSPAKTLAPSIIATDVDADAAVMCRLLSDEWPKAQA